VDGDVGSVGAGDSVILLSVAARGSVFLPYDIFVGGDVVVVAYVGFGHR